MRRRTSIAIVAVVAGTAAAAVAIPLAALDDGPPRLTREQYSERVTTVFRKVEDDFRRPAGAALSTRLRGMTAALGHAAEALDRLHPPLDAERDHRLLVAATRDYAAQIDLLRASVDFGDTSLIAAHLRAVTAPAAIRRVLRDLARRRYRIPVNVVSSSR